MPALASTETFVPHSYQSLLDSRTFVPALPEKFYEGLVRECANLTDVEVSHITYENDGLTITGLMALPKNLKTKNHPIAIYNRGGRNEYGKLTVLSVMRSMVPLAKEGYLVFASNYRGNDGGDGHDEFGGGDVGDVLKLLSIAQAHDAYDGKNAFMIGHSRGGMMTYLCMKAKAALTACVAIAGISDLRGSDSGFAKFLPAGEYAEDALAQRSARAWPELLKTPLLLLHGTGDEVIKDTHSRLLAEDLDKTGLEHELVLYDNGNHALVRHWDQVTARIHSWLEAHRS